MYKIDNLQRQHEDIKNNIDILKKITINIDKENNTQEAAKRVNILAGQLKIHLNGEDKYLYPTLLKSNNEKVKNTAKRFNDEMNHMLKGFNDYKIQYNTKSKIENNLNGFVKDTKGILQALENRISKEDLHLFPLI